MSNRTDDLPTPPPWRLREIFELADWLAPFYGRPHDEWPDPATWPVPPPMSGDGAP
jgi:hypothetical protein